MSTSEESIDDYILLKDIGEGNFGKVKLGIKKKTGEKYAIKIMNKEKIKTQMGKTFIPEIEISKKFVHKNVIHVYSILEDCSNYYIIMEYCSKGELFDYIVSRIKLSKEESSLFFYQLINGIEYIHSKGYAHRDLKPENLLLTHNNILKIIDFGLTHEYNDNMLLQTKCGSPSYAAPEILKGSKYDGFKSDIWCCGIILYAMLSGFLPFEGENNKILFKNIIKCEFKLSQFEDEDIKQLIKRLLNPNPKLRISLNEIKKTEFYLNGEKLCNKIEFNKKNTHSSERKYLKLKKNNIFIENPNSKRLNKHNAYKIFDKLSTDRINKLNLNLLNHTNDNSISKESKKINNDRKSLEVRIYQTSKNAEEIISRHSHKNQMKLNPYLKIINKKKNVLKYNINDKIKRLLKKNNSEEDKDKKIENIIPKIRKPNENYVIDCNNITNESDLNIKIEKNKINENNNNINNIKIENYDSLSIKSKVYNPNDTDRSKSLNVKNKLSIHNNRFQKELITTEPLKFLSKEKNNNININKKSYNLYKMFDSTEKLAKSSGLKYKKFLFTENSKLHKKKVINLHNREIMNQFLPLLNKYK